METAEAIIVRQHPEEETGTPNKSWLAQTITGDRPAPSGRCRERQTRRACAGSVRRNPAQCAEGRADT
jgi:hypothetical protein